MPHLADRTLEEVVDEYWYSFINSRNEPDLDENETDDFSVENVEEIEDVSTESTLVDSEGPLLEANVYDADSEATTLYDALEDPLEDPSAETHTIFLALDEDAAHASDPSPAALVDILAEGIAMYAEEVGLADPYDSRLLVALDDAFYAWLESFHDAYGELANDADVYLTLEFLLGRMLAAEYMSGLLQRQE